ncbi:MAG: hypothetical protein WAV90_02160, partial [Gordonia amarae]
GYTTHVTAITPTGTTTTTLTGYPYFLVQFAPDGTAYQTTQTGNSTTGYTTHVTAITPTGTTTTTFTGYPEGRIQFASDGTAYQTTRTVTGVETRYVTAITPTGVATTITTNLPHYAAPGVVQVAPNGSVLQTMGIPGATMIVVIKRPDPAIGV